MAILMQVITIAQIWAAIAAQGYRLNTMYCHYEQSAPSVCWMPLRLDGDYIGGWLTAQVVGSDVIVVEHTPGDNATP